MVFSIGQRENVGGHSMKMFTAFVIGAVATLACGATTVLAQSDPIKTREHLMKGNNDHAKIFVNMVKGQ
jgi:hypothetical protein